MNILYPRDCTMAPVNNPITMIIVAVHYGLSLRRVFITLYTGARAKASIIPHKMTPENGCRI